MRRPDELNVTVICDNIVMQLNKVCIMPLRKTIFKGEFQYNILVFLLMATTAFSAKLNLEIFKFICMLNIMKNIIGLIVYLLVARQNFLLILSSISCGGSLPNPEYRTSP